MAKWWMIRARDNNEPMPLWRKEGMRQLVGLSSATLKNFRYKSELQQQADKVFYEKTHNWEQVG